MNKSKRPRKDELRKGYAPLCPEKPQALKNQFGFSTLAKNERRKLPVFGGVWFEPGREDERKAFIAQWQVTTAEMLRLDPSLKIVD